MGLHPGQNLRRMEGADDIIHCPGFKSDAFMLRILHCRNKNYGNIPGPRIGFESAANFETVHFRHDHIQENEGRKLLFNAFQCGLSAFGNCESILILKGVGKDVYIGGSIINYHYQIVHQARLLVWIVIELHSAGPDHGHGRSYVLLFHLF